MSTYPMRLRASSVRSQRKRISREFTTSGFVIFNSRFQIGVISNFYDLGICKRSDFP